MWLILTMNGMRCAYLREHRAEHAERRGDGVAAALDRELDDVLGIEVVGVLGERRARGVLDALVDGQDRDIARAAEPAVGEDALERAQHGAGRLLSRTTRSTKSGPGRWRRSLAIVLHSWPRRSSASSPRIDSMRSMPLAELVMAMSRRVPSRRARSEPDPPRLARPASAGSASWTESKDWAASTSASRTTPRPRS